MRNTDDFLKVVSAIVNNELSDHSQVVGALATIVQLQKEILKKLDAIEKQTKTSITK